MLLYISYDIIIQYNASYVNIADIEIIQKVL